MSTDDFETIHLDFSHLEKRESTKDEICNDLIDDLDGLDGVDDVPSAIPLNLPTAASLRLINKRISIRFCEFKISNTSDKMLTSETISISHQGILFNAPLAYSVGSIVRIWIEMPDYWARKSRHVGYRHTNAPTFFQMLVRVVSFEETNKRNQKMQMLCQTLNLDPIDEVVLNDYLGVKI